MSDIEKRRNGYYSNFTFRGKRIRRTLGTSDPEEARRNCDRLKSEIWDEPKKKTHSYTFSDAVEVWMESGEKDISDRYRIRAFDLMDTPLSRITSASLAELLQRHNGSTRNRVINLLTAILNCAVKRGWMETLPTMQRVKVKESRTRWLTREEWERLKSELPGNLRQMARFAVATGLRENNVIGMEWSHIDMRRKVAWVHGDTMKAGKAIGIPLSDDAIDVLREQLGNHNKYVFTYDGHKVTKASTKSWKAALVRAGIDVVVRNEQETSEFRWHELRHTWASWHVMAGTPLEVLQKLGGWKTLQMVLRYAHLAPEYLAGYANNATTKNEQLSHVLPHVRSAS